MKSILITGLSAFALSASMTAQAQVTTVNRAISEPEVQAAQQAWCKALVDISTAHTNHGQAAAKALAEKVIDADRKSTRLNSSHPRLSRMPSSA